MMKVPKKQKIVAGMVIAILCVAAISGCGKKEKKQEKQETKVETTAEETTIEETQEEETFANSVVYNVVIDTSKLSDEETSQMITYLRETAQSNHMEVGLGQARYNELVLEITCYYNDKKVTANIVKETLLDGLVIKTIN